MKESSLSTYAIHAEKHLLPFFGNKSDVTENEVQEFALMKLREGLSRNTIRDILLVLRMVMSFGMRHDMITYYNWKIHLPKENERKELPVLTKLEQRRMMDFLNENFSFRNLGLYICICTGMRIGEICALKWDDINLNTKTIMIRRTIERVYVREKEQSYTKVVIGAPKTINSIRDIPVSGDLIRILRPIMSLVNTDNYVISNKNKPIEPRIYRTYYKRVMTKLGMPNIKFHGLRHTFATRCIESNCDYKTVSSILGHASISTTMNLYVHPNIDQKRKCIEKMLRTVKK
ncbi:MAG: site-specific integrase [Prevotellaceae bacterium]|nr:site-specific integrase [Prevotellaceae bacterium]